MLFVKKVLHCLDKTEENIIAVVMAVVLFILTIQVFTRYLFSYSFSWAEQVARIGFVWITLMGVSLAAKKGMHLKVEAATTFLPKKIAGAIQVFSDIFTITFGLFLSWRVLGIVIMQFQRWQTFPSIPWLPVWVMYIAGVLGLFGLAARTFEVRFWPYIRQSAKRQGG